MDGLKIIKGMEIVVNKALDAAGSFAIGYLFGIAVKANPELAGCCFAAKNLAQTFFSELPSKLASNKGGEYVVRAVTGAFINTAAIVAMRHFSIIAGLGTVVFGFLAVTTFSEEIQRAKSAYRQLHV